MKRVAYIFPTSHHYRLPFHERLRALLAIEGIDYKVVYSAPGKENVHKRDTVEIEWGVKVPRLTIPSTRLTWQMALKEAVGADLVIMQQENSLLLNYVFTLASMAGIKRVAYFGHGRNFQARNRNSLAERWKGVLARRCDWWFGYTEETRRHLLSVGFPDERITVFNNSVDTGALQAMAASIDDADAAAFAASLGADSAQIGIFVGGLYSDKRLTFLVAAADRVRARVPNFNLLIVGGGTSFDEVKAAAASRPWMIVTGPRFGREKVMLMRAAKLFLMPGLVGLAVLDAAAVGLPIVTTTYPYHSPEIAYVEDGVQGTIVQDWQDEAAYADAVATLLEDDAIRRRMAAAARETAERYTIDAMAKRFARGVVKALEA